MKKHTTFPNLIQKIIPENVIEHLTEKIGYEDSARKLNVPTLIVYLVTASMNEWKSYRHCSDAGPSAGLVKIDYSTLSKKAAQLDFHLMKQLFDFVVSKCNRVTRRNLKIPNQLLIVDSTTITVGKTRLPWAVYHGERSGVKLHVSYTPETEMPLKVEETKGLVHDGPVGEKLAESAFILVEDRAYFQIKRIDRFVSEHQYFVIRMKENVELVRSHALKRLTPSISSVTRDITCFLGTPQSRSAMRHRVVFFKDDKGNPIRVVTNLMNTSAESIADMYKARWQIETFFRWVKQHLNVPILFGTTKNAVYNQLFAALIAYVLIKWLYDRTAKSRIFMKLSFISFKRKVIANDLPLDWVSEMTRIIKNASVYDGIRLSNFG